MKRLLVRGTTFYMTVLVGALLLTTGGGEKSLPVTLATWFLVCFIAESLGHRSLDGVTHLSVAPAAHVAALALLPILWGVPVVTVAAAGGAFLLRREARGQALARTAAAAAAALGALAVILAGESRWFLGASQHPVSVFQEPRYFAVIAVAGIAYTAVLQSIIATTTGRIRRVRGVRAWKEAFGSESELFSSGALLFVATLAVLCYEALGYRGILLCIMPVMFVRDGSRRNIELERAQGKLIKNERLAAKGEMAAEIGHELNNYLAAISGRAQLVLRQLTPEDDSAISAEAERSRELANQMGELAKGLMDFSHREVQRTEIGINELIEKTVDFVRPQTRFRAWNFSLVPATKLPRVQIDPGQIQQVLLILLGRVAETASRPAAEQVLRIQTLDDAQRKSVAIEIGPFVRGARESDRGSDLREEGPLDTVRRILDRHQGQFALRESEEGEIYEVLLPAA